MVYSFAPKGVCSREMHIDINEQGVIENLQVIGGCSGNLQGISALVKGMTAQDAIDRLRGIHCGFKTTSCPDQLARGLAMILEKQANK